jgi:hypothetical protein
MCDEPASNPICALEKFQRDHGLQVALRPDRTTASALRDSICF